jgi:hypothetical protein
MLTIEDQSLLEDVGKKESMGLSPRKVIDSDRTIYSSHKLGRPKDALVLFTQSPPLPPPPPPPYPPCLRLLRQPLDPFPPTCL